MALHGWYTPVPVDYSFYDDAVRRDLHSFPTRRSSDLLAAAGHNLLGKGPAFLERSVHYDELAEASIAKLAAFAESAGMKRSEEHTSELQSRRDLVCRLLLEKKNRRYPALRAARPARQL